LSLPAGPLSPLRPSRPGAPASPWRPASSASPERGLSPSALLQAATRSGHRKAKRLITVCTLHARLPARTPKAPAPAADVPQNPARAGAPQEAFSDERRNSADEGDFQLASSCCIRASLEKTAVSSTWPR